MVPILFKIGPFTIASYGTMLFLAFFTCYLLGRREFKQQEIPLVLMDDIMVLAMIGGIVGSKVYYLLENFTRFLERPIAMAFSTAGFTAYGGFILASILCTIAIRRKNQSGLKIAEILVPLLALGYGIGRIGCQLAGDGDYGIPTTLPWGMSYPHGVIPTLEIVHPAPVYETLYSTFLFFFLWLRRKKVPWAGQQICLYLIFTGLGRFCVEFIRLNERVLWGLSGAQIIAFAAALVGFIFILRGHLKINCVKN
jgi:phosphatidylglycerol:prolipoprotein diacylglycerol transferase